MNPGCGLIGWLEKLCWVREEPGQNPVFHAPPGGTEAAAKRPISSEENFVLCAFTLWELFNWGTCRTCCGVR